MLTPIADAPIVKDIEKASRAFATPTIIHFSAVLMLSADISVPWQAIAPASVLWGLLGLAGLIYVVIVVRRMKLQNAYSPAFEDRLFHLVVPLVAYATITVSAFMSRLKLHAALLSVAAGALLLLFVGIHNAWDAVTYYVFVRKHGRS